MSAAGNILAKVAQGDQESIRECLNRYSALVWSIALRLLPSREDAEDVVQEVFLDIWKNASRYDSAIGTEKTFIVMISRRRIIDRQRQLGRRHDNETLDEKSLALEDEPAGDMVLQEEAVQARDCFEQLKVESQRVLRLAIYEGLSQAHISKQTGIPLGSVKTYSRRGMAALRDCMRAKSIAGGRQ